MRTLFARLGVLVALAFAAGALSVSSAFAHAEPATVVPADGAIMSVSPAQVVITTTEEMDGSASNTLHVFDAANHEVTTTAATVSAAKTTLTVALPANLAAGVYTIKWATVSGDDGDSADGTFTFTIAAAQPSPSPTSPPATATATTTAAPTAVKTATVAPAAPGTGSGVQPEAEGSLSWLWAAAAGAFTLSVLATGAAISRRTRH